MNVPALDPQNILRLTEIENKLYYINMKDRWEQEDHKEYARLTAEREGIRHGEIQSAHQV